MKRLIYGLLLCFIMGLTQVAWAVPLTLVKRPTHKRTHLEVILPYLVVTRKNQLRLMKVGRLAIPQSTTNNTTNAYSGDTRVTSSASAPSMSAMSQDLCVVGISGGVSTFGVGFSGGTYMTDENCERIKLCKVLNDLGMKVAAVSILCQDPRVFFAMEQSGTLVHLKER